MSTYKVHVKPQNIIFDIDGDTDLLSALREQDIYVKSSCGGYATCSDCMIKILEGVDNVNAPSFEETQMIGNVFHITKERLSCQTKVTGDITIDLSSHDPSADAKKLRQKANKFIKSKAPVKKRSKAEVDEIHEERRKSREEKEERQNSWQKYWEREDQEGHKRGRGGGRRPKTFRTDHLEEQKAKEEANRDQREKKDSNKKSK